MLLGRIATNILTENKTTTTTKINSYDKKMKSVNQWT